MTEGRIAYRARCTSISAAPKLRRVTWDGVLGDPLGARVQRVEDGAHLLAAERLCGGQREQRQGGAQQQKRRRRRRRQWARAARGAQGVHGSGTATLPGKDRERRSGEKRSCDEVELSESSMIPCFRLGPASSRCACQLLAFPLLPLSPSSPLQPVQKTSDSLLTCGTRLSGSVARAIWSLYTCARARLRACGNARGDPLPTHRIHPPHSPPLATNTTPPGI